MYEKEKISPEIENFIKNVLLKYQRSTNIEMEETITINEEKIIVKIEKNKTNQKIILSLINDNLDFNIKKQLDIKFDYETEIKDIILEYMNEKSLKTINKQSDNELITDDNYFYQETEYDVTEMKYQEQEYFELDIETEKNILKTKIEQNYEINNKNKEMLILAIKNITNKEELNKIEETILFLKKQEIYDTKNYFLTLIHDYKLLDNITENNKYKKIIEKEFKGILEISENTEKLLSYIDTNLYGGIEKDKEKQKELYKKVYLISKIIKEKKLEAELTFNNMTEYLNKHLITLTKEEKKEIINEINNPQKEKKVTEIKEETPIDNYDSSNISEEESIEVIKEEQKNNNIVIPLEQSEMELSFTELEAKICFGQYINKDNKEVSVSQKEYQEIMLKLHEEKGTEFESYLKELHKKSSEFIKKIDIFERYYSDKDNKKMKELIKTIKNGKTATTKISQIKN